MEGSRPVHSLDGDFPTSLSRLNGKDRYAYVKSAQRTSVSTPRVATTSGLEREGSHPWSLSQRTRTSPETEHDYRSSLWGGLPSGPPWELSPRISPPWTSRNPFPLL